MSECVQNIAKVTAWKRGKQYAEEKKLLKK